MSWWVLLGYLVFQTALGLMVSRGMKSELDYFAAGRRLGTPWVAFSLFATWFGAETCLGASGAIYTQGLSGGRADPLGYCLCLFLLAGWLSARLWAQGHLTIGDLFRQRFGVGVEKLVVLVLVPSSILWAAAQVRAFGQVLAGTIDVDVTLALYVAAGLVALYTAFGGLLGDVVTDLVQGIVLAIGLVALVVVAFGELGGPWEGLAGIPAHRWAPWTAEESPWEQLDRWAVPVLGSLITQELLARIVAARSGSVARRASWWAGGLYLLIGLCPVVLGLVGPRLIPGLDDPEQLLPALARKLLPPAGAAAFVCSLISAILSTVDSVLLAVSALLSHNLIVPALGVKSERMRLMSARAVVLGGAALALFIALNSGSVYALVEAASGFGTAGVLVTTLAAMFVPRGGARAASTALVTGAVGMPLLDDGLGWPMPFLSTIALSALSYAFVAAFDPWAAMVPNRELGTDTEASG